MRKNYSRLLFLVSISLLSCTMIVPSGKGYEMIWNFKAADWIREVAISDDGSTIVAVGYDQKVHIFNNEDPTPLWSYQTNRSLCTAVISSQGDYIITGNTNGWVHFFGKNNSDPL